jgi:hypothetical protein
VKVEANRSYILFTLLTLLLGVGLVFLSWALWRTRLPDSSRQLAREASLEMPAASR